MKNFFLRKKDLPEGVIGKSQLFCESAQEGEGSGLNIGGPSSLVGNSEKQELDNMTAGGIGKKLFKAFGREESTKYITQRA